MNARKNRLHGLMVLLLALLVTAGFPVPGRGQTQVTPNVQPPPTGTATVVNNGPGDHSDPHISGTTVSYSNSDGTNFTVRYHDVVSGSDNGVPNSGTLDFLSDVNANTIAFTRVSPSSSAIFKYALGAASATEVAPQAGGVPRQNPQIGNSTIAWQEFASAIGSDIVAYDIPSGSVTRVTNDGLLVLNQVLGISPDGTVLAWLKCATIAAPCDVWSATRSGLAWTVHQLTNLAGNCSHPDTNGSAVVYSCNRGAGDRLFWQPAAGGPEQELNLAGQQSSPSIGGPWVAFSGLAPATTAHKIFVYNLSTNNLYQVSNTSGDNQLSDITVNADGTVRVVWQVQQASTAVYAFSFKSSVEFAAFSAQAAINVSQKQFAVGGQFTLGNGSSGIDLSTQDVTLQLVEDHGPGNFSITIPAGQGTSHFQSDGHGDCFFSGTINGVQLRAIISPFPGSTCQSANLGPYSYGFAGQGANNLPSTNTVTVTLAIGNNTGSKSVNAFFQTGSD
jgi:hypothetical protein